MIGQVEGLHDVADLLIHEGELALVLESLEEVEGLLPAKAGRHEGIGAAEDFAKAFQCVLGRQRVRRPLCFVQSAQVGRDYLHASPKELALLPVAQSFTRVFHHSRGHVKQDPHQRDPLHRHLIARTYVNIVQLLHGLVDMHIGQGKIDILIPQLYLRVKFTP